MALLHLCPLPISLRSASLTRMKVADIHLRFMPGLEWQLSHDGETHYVQTTAVVHAWFSEEERWWARRASLA